MQDYVHFTMQSVLSLRIGAVTTYLLVLLVLIMVPLLHGHWAPFHWLLLYAALNLLQVLYVSQVCQEYFCRKLLPQHNLQG